MTRQRMSLKEVAPSVYAAMLQLEKALRDQPLERSLAELVKLRASQLNQCVFCLDMHARDAVASGEDERRLHTVAAWREAPWFTARERAALGLTEAVTLLAESGVPDEVWQQAASVFDDAELAALLMTIVTINAWNRIAVSTRTQPVAADAQR